MKVTLLLQTMKMLVKTLTSNANIKGEAGIPVTQSEDKIVESEESNIADNSDIL